MKKTASFSLLRDEAVSDGLLRILASASKVVRDLGKPGKKVLPDSVHALRVLIKRLRALLWFLRPILTDDDYDQGKALLKKAADTLAESRDLTVVRAVFEQVAATKTGKKKQLAASRVSQAIANHGSGPVGSGEVTPEILRETSGIILQAVQELHRVIRAHSELPSPAKRIKKALRATCKTAGAALKKEDPSLLHEWRKNAKRLLYELELAQNQPRQKWTDQIGAIDKLQQVLGEFHDTVVAGHHLDDHRPEDLDEADLARTHSMLEKKRKRLLRDAKRLWKSVLKEL